LKTVKQLGKGMFGNVTLCVHAHKGTFYALKSVSRQKVRLYDLSTNLILERQLLLQLDHSFIMKLIKTFKDKDRVYFLLEFVHGQDLFDVIRVLGLLQDSDAKFYTSCLVLILEHLHERDIIYRDLKPENIMVDDMGYPKLIDFGTAKVVTQGRTFTTVGTPHYTAPEVLSGKGYGLSADYWSLGIIIYEFLCGQVPFGEEEEDTYMIYEKVLHAPLEYPRMISQSFPARNLIETLLNRNPSARTAGGIEKLKNNRWFHGFDWVNVT
jgi:cGMP-dependent protein kinase